MLVRRDRSCLRLKEGGSVFGVFPDGIYVEDEIELCAGDRLLLFTDGLTEAENSLGEQFGEERLLALLTRERKSSAADLRDRVNSSVADFCSGDFQDDATCIVVAVH
jgi:sigma-B regulation protein RsbU (phosphoserine phosphatase)